MDMERKVILCAGREFPFVLDPIEEALLRAGGLISVYDMCGTTLFRQLQSAANRSRINSSNGRLDSFPVETPSVVQDW